MQRMRHHCPRPTADRLWRSAAGVWARGTALAIVLLTIGVASVHSASPEADTAQTPPEQVVGAAVEQSVTLFMDFVVIVEVPGDVTTIVLGNADIADASLVSDGILALTGKAVGTTNIVILGLDGDVLAELQIQVATGKPGAVMVRRALTLSRYACTESSCLRTDADTDSVATP